TFPHAPEPKPETMAQLSAVVRAGKADIGFAHDADGERLGIVTELGQPLSEEFTLGLATRIRLEERAGAVVTNVSTTGAIEEIAAVYGGSGVGCSGRGGAARGGRIGPKAGLGRG